MATRSRAPRDSNLWIRPGRYYTKWTENGVVRVPLTNFSAKIVGDIVLDDGLLEERHFEIEAKLKDQKPHCFKVPASKFASLNWVPDYLGPGAIVYPGYTIRDRARAAIQELSERTETRRVFAHLGWREIAGTSVYLHAGGAIGRSGTLSGADVSIPSDLERYCLPDPPSEQDLRDALPDSLFLLELLPDKVSMPIYASIWAAVLRQPDFSLHITGPTGGGKSEFAALAQAHWGSGFDARHLPGHWSSTANALERLTFCAKDALLVVDDFAPSGTSADVARLHRDADRLLRAAGNQGGRARLNRDVALRKTMHPRALILSTGEDVPRGQSLRSRILVIEIEPGQMNWGRLTAAQRSAAAGTLATVMAAFIRWVAERRGSLDRWMSERRDQIRSYAYADGRHRRTPDIVANLAVGFEVFTMFCRDAGVFKDAWKEYWNRCWNALGAVAAAQAMHQRSQEPAQQFVQLLGAAILSGRCHVASGSGESPTQPEQWGWRVVSGELRPQGDRVGWIDEKGLYLEPDAAHAVARRIASETGENFGLTPQTLHKRLWEQGLLESRDDEHLTVKRSVEGHRRRILHLRSQALLDARGQEETTDAPAGVPELSAPVPPDGAPAGKPRDVV